MIGLGLVDDPTQLSVLERFGQSFQAKIFFVNNGLVFFEAFSKVLRGTYPKSCAQRSAYLESTDMCQVISRQYARQYLVRRPLPKG